MSKSSESSKVIGIHAVSSLLTKHPGRIARVCVLSQRQDGRIRGLLGKARERRVEVELLEKSAFEAQLGEDLKASHQGVVAWLRMDRQSNEGDLDEMLENLPKDPLFLILDGVTDPHNLGACLRSANAAGVLAVIVPKDKSAPLNAAARKVASGAAEITPLIRVTNLARTMKHMQSYGVWIVGTAGEAENDIYDSDLRAGLALVMGAEGKGMRRLTREHCDELVKLPMLGEVSSLNVSVATGVCLFEINRQRHKV